MIDFLYNILETLLSLPLFFGVITPGEPAKASDYINESEKDGTPANDEGRVSKLESDARIHKNFLPADTLFNGDANSKIEIDTTEVTIANTTTEANLFSVSIPANILGTNNGIRIKVFFSALRSPGSGENPIFRLKLGSTTLVTLNMSIGGTGDTGILKGMIEAHIVADGATNAQKAFMQALFHNTDSEVDGEPNIQITKNFGVGNGSSAEDSTEALTLSITGDWDGFSVNATMTAEFWIVEKISSL